jgi:hypothetical protein
MSIQAAAAQALEGRRCDGRNAGEETFILIFETSTSPRSPIRRDPKRQGRSRRKDPEGRHRRDARIPKRLREGSGPLPVIDDPGSLHEPTPDEKGKPEVAGQAEQPDVESL